MKFPYLFNGWHGEFNQGSQISGKHGTQISDHQHVSHEKKHPTFHYTDWLIGIRDPYNS